MRRAIATAMSVAPSVRRGLMAAVFALGLHLSKVVQWDEYTECHGWCPLQFSVPSVQPWGWHTLLVVGSVVTAITVSFAFAFAKHHLSQLWKLCSTTTSAWAMKQARWQKKIRSVAKHHKKKWQRWLCSGFVVVHSERGFGDFMAITWLLRDIPAICRLFARFPRQHVGSCCTSQLMWCLVVCTLPLRFMLARPSTQAVLQQVVEVLRDMLAFVGLEFDRMFCLSRRQRKQMQNGVQRAAASTHTSVTPVWHRMIRNMITLVFMAGSWYISHMATAWACPCCKLALRHLLSHHSATILSLIQVGHYSCMPLQ